jgi:hypothetical protein
MKTISKERIAEIKAFHNTDFSDCPELTDEQLAQMRPSRHQNRKNKVFMEIPDDEPVETPAEIPAVDAITV